MNLLSAGRGYLGSLLLVAFATLICEFIRPHLVPTNMVMVYQLVVVIAAVKLGRRPAIATAFLAVLAFDFFFVPPRLTFSVAEKEYLVTFLGFFVVGVIISSLVAKVREQSLERERLAKDAEKARILQVQENLERALLNSISHDLRTPLVSIKGALSALKDEGERLSGQARQELLDTASDEAERLNRFVGNLLDMTRLEAGAMSFEHKEFSVWDVVRSALEVVSFLAEEKQLNLISTIDDSVPVLITGDEGRLRQVLVNLLGNSVKFTEQGEVEVAVHGFEPVGAQANRFILFSVRDTGTGIPADQLEMIFARFTQVDSSLTRRHGGTGLGLALTRQIVEKMGGSIWAESREGAGSTFFFTLPEHS